MVVVHKVGRIITSVVLLANRVAVFKMESHVIVRNAIGIQMVREEDPWKSEASVVILWLCLHTSAPTQRPKL